MSISTYAELQTAVENWLDRDDLSTAMVKDLILAGEIRLYDDIKLRAMETALSESIIAGKISVDPIDGFLGFKGTTFMVSDDTRYPLIQESEAWVKSTFTDTASTNTGRPDYFYVNSSGGFTFEKYTDAAYTMTGTYYKRLTLSDSATTNWVLSNYPMVLLYASLLEAQVLTEDDPRRYEVMYDEQLKRMRRNENRVRFGAQPRTFRQVPFGSNPGTMGTVDTSCSKRW